MTDSIEEETLADESIATPLELNDPDLAGRLLSPLSNLLPQSLALIPINHAVIFPGMIVPMILSQDRHKTTIGYIMDQKGIEAPYIGIAIIRANVEGPFTEKN